MSATPGRTEHFRSTVIPSPRGPDLSFSRWRRCLFPCILPQKSLRIAKAVQCLRPGPKIGDKGHQIPRYSPVCPRGQPPGMAADKLVIIEMERIAEFFLWKKIWVFQGLLPWIHSKGKLNSFFGLHKSSMNKNIQQFPAQKFPFFGFCKAYHLGTSKFI